MIFYLFILICPLSVYVFQVPWPPRSMAESWKRRLQWEKRSRKTLQGVARPTDQTAGREDAHGPVFPTRGPCHSRARYVFHSQRWKDTSYILLTRSTNKLTVKELVSSSKRPLSVLRLPNQTNFCDACFPREYNKKHFSIYWVITTE